MEQKGFYTLPELKFDYSALEPFISKEQLTLHHQKHHKAYVDNANNILRKLDEARKADKQVDSKAIAKELSFNIAGHKLHKIFWESLRPNEGKDPMPQGTLKKEIEANFGSFERFKKEFSQTASSVEGSGWAALGFSRETKRLILMQVEKHNTNVMPKMPIVMALDVWEHAYYLDYKNDRAKFIDAFWKIVNFEEINNKLESIMSTTGKSI